MKQRLLYISPQNMQSPSNSQVREGEEIIISNGGGGIPWIPD